MVQEKEVDSAAAVGCIARTIHQCAVFWVPLS